MIRLCALVVVLAVGRYGHALLSQPSSYHNIIRKESVAVVKTSTSALSPLLHNKLCLHHSSAVVEKEGATISTEDNRTCGNTTISDENDYNEQLLVKELGRAFSQRFIELQDYKRLHNDCMVPKRYKNNPSLGNWVNKQRQNYRRFVKGEKTSMNEKKITALNEIGFVWDASSLPNKSTNENAWQRMYNQLSQFYDTNGHCNVQSTKPLGQWVVRQRYLYRKSSSSSSLTEERIDLLNKLNFPWKSRSEQIWDTRIKELHDFKQINGHVNVPTNYPSNPKLSTWVSTQRKNYNRKGLGKTSPLTNSRIQELNDLGFVWSYWDSVMESRWSNEQFDHEEEDGIKIIDRKP